jgi:hypothetical protein
MIARISPCEMACDSLILFPLCLPKNAIQSLTLLFDIKSLNHVQEQLALTRSVARKLVDGVKVARPQPKVPW